MKVSQIKTKVAAKVAKGRAKVAKKCGKAKKSVASVLVLFGLCAGLTGCLIPSAPSRSQTLTIHDCTVHIYGGGAETGDVARVDMASQAMSIENSGSEAQTVSPSQTVDTKPEIAVGVGGSSAGVGGGSSAGVGGGTSAATAKKGLGERIGSAADAVVDALPSKGDDAAAPAAPAAQSAAPAAQAGGASCPGGNCPASGEAADCPACRLPK